MKTVVIHPDYACFSEFINCLPEIFNTEGKRIFKQRNELKIFERTGLEFVVKSYKIPHIINKIAYSFLRDSKAKRSFRYATILLNKGIQTPTPVAYIEIRKYGLLFNSFFISIKSRLDREIREISDSPDSPEVYSVLTELARFTADLHNHGVFHQDYSPGNILFGKTGGHYDFELVDLNRIRFCKVTMKMGCKDLRRLYVVKDHFVFLARQYAQQRGFDPDMCEKIALKFARITTNTHA